MIENYLYCGFISNFDKGQVNNPVHSILLNSLSARQYNRILICDAYKEIVNRINLVEEIFEREQEEWNLTALYVGIVSLEMFVEHNFTGLRNSVENVERDETALNLLKSFKHDCDVFYRYMCCPEYLAIAKAILFDSINFLDTNAAKMWSVRYINVVQSFMEERSPELKRRLMEIIDNVSTEAMSNEAQIQYFLEVSHLLHFYYEPSMATEFFQKALSLSQLKMELTGAMGKRTRFQQKDVAQLYLQVDRLAEPDDEPKTLEACDVTYNVPLDDEAVMERISFNEENLEFLKLRPVEQAVILSQCVNHRKSHEGQGDIVKEESLAYVEVFHARVLADPTCWSVQAAALKLRCDWECTNSRRLQRTLLQLEELSKRTECKSTRTYLSYCVRLQPLWRVERDLARLNLRVGAVQSALEIFLRLELWDEVISAYIQLGARQKAEAVIRAELEKRRTPELLCYLGDATHDIGCYEEAWELSEHRSARAMRSLGYHYLKKGKFAESLEPFERSLAVNPLQVGVWFSYGCACLSAESYSNGVKAFKTCVTLEPDNFEGWNNMATCYVKLGDKSKAFTALQESLKCDYENWRVWENILIVGADCGEFEDVIHAYHRLIELKHKWTDPEVLRVLVRAVNEDLRDARGAPSARLRVKLRKLLGHVVATGSVDSLIWELYANLLLGNTDRSEEDSEQGLQYLQKAVRHAITTAGWEREQTTCVGALKLCRKTVHAYLEVVPQTKAEGKKTQMLSSVKLMARGIVMKIQKSQLEYLESQPDSELCVALRDLEKDTQRIVDMIDDIKR